MSVSEKEEGKLNMHQEKRIFKSLNNLFKTKTVAISLS